MDKQQLLQITETIYAELMKFYNNPHIYSTNQNITQLREYATILSDACDKLPKPEEVRDKIKLFTNLLFEFIAASDLLKPERLSLDIIHQRLQRALELMEAQLTLTKGKLKRNAAKKLYAEYSLLIQSTNTLKEAKDQAFLITKAIFKDILEVYKAEVNDFVVFCNLYK